MANMEARNVMSGTWGELWLDGNKVAEVKVLIQSIWDIKEKAQ